MVVQGLLEVAHDAIALAGRGTTRHQVLVVEIHTVRAQLGELLDDVRRGHRAAGRLPERVPSGISNGPETKGEFVFFTRLQIAHGRLQRASVHFASLWALATVRSMKCTPRAPS